MLADMRADKTRRAGDQNLRFHAKKFKGQFVPQRVFFKAERRFKENPVQVKFFLRIFDEMAAGLYRGKLCAI